MLLFISSIKYDNELFKLKDVELFEKLSFISRDTVQGMI